MASQQQLECLMQGLQMRIWKDTLLLLQVLFTQPDFVAQKSQLEEYITSQGHICDFYPKYHCELNFIEQYWGAAKLVYRATPKTQDMNVKNALDGVPLL